MWGQVSATSHCTADLRHVKLDVWNTSTHEPFVPVQWSAASLSHAPPCELPGMRSPEVGSGFHLVVSRGHLARAALEGIALQVCDLVQAMSADAGIPLKELRVDGGASMNNLLMQVQADLLGVPVVRPTVTETTALGAAYLAGLAVGFWSSPQAIASHHAIARRFEPRTKTGEADALRQRWAQAVQRAQAWDRP